MPPRAAPAKPTRRSARPATRAAREQLPARFLIDGDASGDDAESAGGDRSDESADGEGDEKGEGDEPEPAPPAPPAKKAKKAKKGTTEAPKPGKPKAGAAAPGGGGGVDGTVAPAGADETVSDAQLARAMGLYDSIRRARRAEKATHVRASAHGGAEAKAAAPTPLDDNTPDASSSSDDNGGDVEVTLTGKKRRPVRAFGVHAQALLAEEGHTTATSWLRTTDVVKDRDLRECEALAEAIDALIHKDGVLPAANGVDVLWRRLQGVVIGSTTSDWSLCEALRRTTRKNMLMAPDMLLALTKDAAILKRGVTSATGAAGSGGGGGRRGVRKGHGGGQAHTGGGKNNRGGGGGDKRGGGGGAAHTKASGPTAAKKT